MTQNAAALAFAEDLFQGKFDMLILLTGVGTRLLNQVIETRWPAGAFAEALRGITVVARGPKPMAVMREWGVPVAVAVPEPNTWREILAATEGRAERRVAVQEYGRPSQELIDGLRARGAEVTSVPVYQWDLPEDLGSVAGGGAAAGGGGDRCAAGDIVGADGTLVESGGGDGSRRRRAPGLRARGDRVDRADYQRDAG